jgi:hypothetical protein
MPVLPRLSGRVDGALDLPRAALVDVREHVRLRVGHDGLARRPGLDVLAADDKGDLHPLALHLLETHPQALSLRRAGRIVSRGLVHGGG